jgi:sulfite exporter TauE/SafE
MSTIIVSGLVMGFGASLGCLVSCVPVLLPYTAAAAQPSARSGLTSSILFSLGRLAAYTGLLVVLIALREIIDISIKVEAAATLVSGAILIISGLVSLGIFRWNSVLNRVLCRYISTTRSPLYLGILTGIRPCGPLLAALAFVLTLPSAANMSLFLFFFWLASSVLMLGIGVAGGSLGTVLSHQIGLDRTRRIAGLTMVVIGIFFTLQAIGLLIQ